MVADETICGMASILWELVVSAVEGVWFLMGTTAYGYWLVPICGAFIGWSRAKDRRSIKAFRIAFIDALAAAALVFLIVFSWELFWNIPHGIWRQSASTPPPKSAAPPPVPIFDLPAQTDQSKENKLRELRQRTGLLAKEILDFADLRYKDPNEIQAHRIAYALLKGQNSNDSESDRYEQYLRNWFEQTQLRFATYYWPQVVALEQDLDAAGVDVSPISRAVALNGPNAIGLRLSAIEQRIGKHPPVERVVTSLEANAIPRAGWIDHVVIYADDSDPNSKAVAESLRKGFEVRHWNVNQRVLKLEMKSPKPSGIHVIYPFGDVESQDTIVEGLLDCELEARSEVIPSTSALPMVSLPGLVNKQPVITVRIEVWPEKPKPQ